MRSNVPQYEMKEPANFEEVLALLKKEPGVWKPFAGGTDLMVLFESGHLKHKKFLNIWNLEELKGIQETNESIQLGALTTYAEVLENRILQEEFPMLCEAARLTAAVAIQNRGTLGGNIVNASPAADSPPALLAYDAEIELVSESGSRWIPYVQFHKGYKQMDIKPEELLKSIRLPRNTKGLKHYYRKVGARKAQAISKTCFAAVSKVEKTQVKVIRIGLGSVAPIPLRCLKTEAVLKGQTLTDDLIKKAIDTLAAEITPIDDVRSTTTYRRQVTLNLLEDFLYPP